MNFPFVSPRGLKFPFNLAPECCNMTAQRKALQNTQQNYLLLFALKENTVPRAKKSFKKINDGRIPISQTLVL